MAEQKQSLYLRVQEKLSNVSTVNSYKELCKLLDEPDYSRPSKAAQLKRQEKEWKKCFTWRKSKQKFINIKMIPKEIFDENLQELKIKREEKSKEQSEKTLQNYIKNYKLNHLLTGRWPSRPCSWGKRGVYIVYNKSNKNSYKGPACYIGSTTVAFYKRFNNHLQPSQTMSQEIRDLMEEKDTHINFLWFAPDDATEDEIHEKEAEFWSIYQKKGYHMLNKHIPQYHRTLKNPNKKKIAPHGSYLTDKDWVQYKKISAKIPSDKIPLLIKFLQKDLKLEFSEDFNMWTEPDMIPKIQKFVEENKKKVEIREVDKDDE